MLQKKIKRLQLDSEELQGMCTEKDKQIKDLQHENSLLKQSSINSSPTETTNYLKRQILKKSEKIKMLQEQIRNNQKVNTHELEAQVKKLKLVFEEEKQVVESKIKGQKKREEELVERIKLLELEKKQSLTEEIEKKLEAYGEELKLKEDLIDSFKVENETLKDQLEILRKSNNLHEFALLSPDIHQISYQVHQLLTIIENLKQGKELSISLLLKEQKSYLNTSKQLINDVMLLKNDITAIKEIISDYHAENYGRNICVTQ